MLHAIPISERHHNTLLKRIKHHILLIPLLERGLMSSDVRSSGSAGRAACRRCSLMQFTWQQKQGPERQVQVVLLVVKADAEQSLTRLHSAMMTVVGKGLCGKTQHPQW